MDEELKKRVAVFRFGAIADFVGGRELDRGETERLLREKCAQRWLIPGSNRTRIGESTFKEWIVRYKRSGNKLESLHPRERSDKGKSRAIGEDMAMGIIALRKQMPGVSLPVLMREAQDRKIIIPSMKVTYASLYRLLQAEGLLHKSPNELQDRRRFESEKPNDLWQSDVMHGPYVTVEGRQRKTYLLCFLDDMSRLICQAEFYLSEGLGSFLDGFRKALLMRGIPRKLYVDNGSAFRSHHLEHTCASLGIALIHTPPYQPQGRGKVERLFRSVREQFLSVHKVSTLSALNEELGKWVDSYNDRTHSSTGQSPMGRFGDNIQCVRPAPKDLEDHFRKASKRIVAKDRTIALNGRLYEAPVNLIGKHITLLYHEQDPSRVEMRFNGETFGFAVMLDVNVNCRIKRNHYNSLQIDPDRTKRYGGGKLFGEIAKQEVQQ